MLIVFFSFVKPVGAVLRIYDETLRNNLIAIIHIGCGKFHITLAVPLSQ